MLGKLLSEIVGSDIHKFFFTNGGAECNEAAIKIARDFTGRHKILSRYRSYHGGTHGAMASESRTCLTTISDGSSMAVRL